MQETGFFKKLTLIIIFLAVCSSSVWADSGSEEIRDPDETATWIELEEEASGESCMEVCDESGYDRMSCEEACIWTT